MMGIWIKKFSFMLFFGLFMAFVSWLDIAFDPNSSIKILLDREWCTKKLLKNILVATGIYWNLVRKLSAQCKLGAYYFELRLCSRILSNNGFQCISAPQKLTFFGYRGRAKIIIFRFDKPY